MTINRELVKKICIFTLAAANLTMGFKPQSVDAQEEIFATPATETVEVSKEEQEAALAEREAAVKEKTEKEDAEKNVFEEADQKIVFIKDAAAKDAPDSTGVVVKTITEGTEAVLKGTNNYATWKVEEDGKTYYVNCNTFEEKEEEVVEETPASTFSWGGSVLTRSAGVNYGPTGKETYYNLPMDGVIATMRAMGNNDPYWVREDGVKMLGDYVMVAANLGVYPRGSLVPCSLGMAIVCDTGGFAAANPTQLDIATAW